MNLYLKMTIFWDVAPYSLVEIYRRFRGAYCIHDQCIVISLIIEAASTCETLVNFYHATQRDMPKTDTFIPVAVRTSNQT
jgi:hypothetical protein